MLEVTFAIATAVLVAVWWPSRRLVLARLRPRDRSLAQIAEELGITPAELRAQMIDRVVPTLDLRVAMAPDPAQRKRDHKEHVVRQHVERSMREAEADRQRWQRIREAEAQRKVEALKRGVRPPASSFSRALTLFMLPLGLTASSLGSRIYGMPTTLRLLDVLALLATIAAVVYVALRIGGIV